jgi:hypothetical protein
MLRFFFSFLFLVFLSTSSFGNENGDLIIRQIKQSYAKQAERLHDLTVEAEVIKGEPEDESDNTHIFKTIYLKYLPDTTLVHQQFTRIVKNGEELTGEKLEKAIEDELEEARKRKGQGLQAPMLRPFTPRGDSLYTLHYVGLGVDPESNRDCYLVRATPTKDEKQLIRGLFFFDTTSLLVQRIEFSPAKMPSNLAFRLTKLDLTLTYEPSGDSIAIPEHIEIFGKAKAAFLFGITIRITEYYRNAVINSELSDSLFTGDE